MNTNNQPSKKSRFYLIYGIIAGVLILASAITLFILHDWLVRYELGQPSHKGNEIFENYFLAKDWDGIYALYDLTLSEFDDRDRFIAYMENTYGDAEFTLSETSVGLTGQTKFNVKADGKKVAGFTLSSSVQNKTTVWALETMDVSLDQATTVTVRVSDGHTVLFDGKEVDPAKYATRFLLYENGQKATELTVTGLLSQPSVTVRADGNEIPCSENADGTILETALADAAYTVDCARMEFIVDGNQWQVAMIRVETGGITLPIPEIPAGKHFVGWAEKVKDDEGNDSLTVRFSPVGAGRILFPAGYELRAMTLYAVFEEGEAKTETTYTVSVQAIKGHTIYLNGEATTDDDIVMTAETDSDEYLEGELHDLRLYEIRREGLAEQPTVTVKDESGNEMPLTYDANTGLYSETLPELQITDEEKEIVFNAVKIYARRMIDRANTADLQTCFDTSTKIYRKVRDSDNWVQVFDSYKFGELTLEGFSRYSDSVFAARVSGILYITRTDDSIKEYELDITFLFHDVDGKPKIYNMTNKDLFTLHEQVRLDFIVGDTLTQSLFVAADSKVLTVPVPTEDGKVLRGWAKKETDDSGNDTYTLVLQPTEDGTVYPGITLSPMKLYAIFE